MNAPTSDDLRSQVADLRAENAALRAALEGNLPRAIAWLYGKVRRQAAALDALQRKGPGHTAAERRALAEAAA